MGMNGVEAAGEVERQALKRVEVAAKTRVKDEALKGVELNNYNMFKN